MENQLKVFEHEQFGKVRTIYNNENDEVWFVARDLSKQLGYKSIEKMYDHVDKEDKKEINPQSQSFQGSCQNRITLEPNPNIFRMVLINESGLYSAIFGSQLPQAKQFKRWVTSEVLPSIRKHGGYIQNQEKMTPELLMANALKLADSIIKEKDQALKEKEKQIEHMKPKQIFADAVTTSKSSVLIGELAKLIKQNGYDIGQNRLFKWMREHGYLIKQRGENYNTPTQYSMNLGLMEIKKRTINNPDGSIRVTKTPKVTGKGQVYFINKFLKDEE